MWAQPGLLQKVWHLPHMFQGTGPYGDDSGCSQGQLVGFGLSLINGGGIF